MHALFLCLLFGITQPPAEEGSLQGKIGQDDPVVEKRIQSLLDVHNRARSNAKLPLLSLDAKLTEAARFHAKDMAEHQKMSHEGSDGSPPAERVKRVGYHYIRTAENVAIGQEEVDQVSQAWMESPEHKENILGEFTQMGAYRAVDEKGVPYWCVVFGSAIPRLNPTEAASQVVEKVNAARKEAGAAPLKMDLELAKVAQAMAVATAGANSLDSENTEQPDLGELIRKAEIPFTKLNQSMAVGNPTPDDLVTKLLEDEKQKAMLLGSSTSVGIGYANASDDTPFWYIMLIEN